MCFFADWNIHWEALAAIGTLLAVVLALLTTIYIELKDYRRRKVEVQSMASALHFEFETNRLALLDAVKSFDTAPLQVVFNPHLSGQSNVNGVHGRNKLLALADTLRRARFSVLRDVAGRIALFDRKDAIALGAVVATATAFQENQDITPQDIVSMDDDHARELEKGMRKWAMDIVTMLEPAARRMATIAKIEKVDAQR